MTRLMSTISRGVRYRRNRLQPPPAVFRPSNSHQQYHGCQKQHRSTSCRSAYHRQSAPPPTCPWLQVEIFQSARCACLQCGCARRARRAGARASCCAPFVRFLSVQLRMKVTFQPPLSSSANPAPSALGIRLAHTINATGEGHICVRSASTVQ